jgi:hypothetical protein
MQVVLPNEPGVVAAINYKLASRLTEALQDILVRRGFRLVVEPEAAAE